VTPDVLKTARLPVFMKLKIAFALVLGAFLGSGPTIVAAQSNSAITPVLFVCEHGSVKSLISASLFNRVAKEQGLAFTAVSRGVNPDAAVPSAIVEELRADHIEVADFKPRRLSSSDIAHASRVIAIGVDLSSATDGIKVPLESWGDIPSATLDYPQARAAILRHINILLDELKTSR